MNDRKIDPNSVRFFSGSSNPELAANIAAYLGVELDRTDISRFSNDNLYIQLGASVRSRSVFIIQTLSPPANDHLMELLMMIDIAKSAAAKEIHAIMPYFSFARSDKKDAPRISVTARLIADLLATAGATQVMSMMFHSPQVHGFFSVPTDPLSARPVFQQHFAVNHDLTDTVVVAPDMGNAKSAARFAKDLGLPFAAGLKERVSDIKVDIVGFVGQEITGYRCALIYDDEIATGGSVIAMAEHLIKKGIKEIWVACTHGVFVRGALERITDFPEIREIVATDTVVIPQQKRHPKLHVLSVAPVFGEAILRNYLHESIGDLFVFGK